MYATLSVGSYNNVFILLAVVCAGRNPMHKLRPSFSTLLRTISQPSYVLFHWIEEDKQSGGPQCDVLGAPLAACHSLYPDLQNMYRINDSDKI